MKTNYSLSVGKQFCDQNCKELTNLFVSWSLNCYQESRCKNTPAQHTVFQQKNVFFKIGKYT